MNAQKSNCTIQIVKLHGSEAGPNQTKKVQIQLSVKSVKLHKGIQAVNKGDLAKISSCQKEETICRGKLLCKQ